MADKSRNILPPTVPFGPTDYFVKNILPLKVEGSHKTVTKTTPRIQCDDEMVLLVKSGRGTMVINNEEFRLQRGAFTCLGPFHNYAVRPEKGESVELLEGHTSCSAYMYILSCPYMKVNKMAVPSPPAVTLLSEKETRDAEETLMRLCDCAGEKDYYSAKLKFFYMMKLLGILISKTHGDPPRRDPRLVITGGEEQE